MSFTDMEHLRGDVNLFGSLPCVLAAVDKMNHFYVIIIAMIKIIAVRREKKAKQIKNKCENEWFDILF